MKKKDLKTTDEDKMRDHYDFDYSKAVWGRTAKRLAKAGYPVMVMLRPEVAKVFKNEASVNEALMKVIEMGKFTQEKPTAKRRKSGKTAGRKPREQTARNG